MPKALSAPCRAIRSRLPAMALLLAAALGAGPAPDQPSIVRVVPDRDAKQPQVAVGPNDRIFLAYGSSSAIHCVTSDDGGQSFGEPVAVGSPGVLALGMRRGPRIAASADSVVIAAIGGTGGGPYGGLSAGDLWVWRSTDGGGSWSEPVRINGVAGSAREGLHALTVSPDGRFFCAWTDLRDDRAHIRGAFSIDGGQTWEPDILVHRSPIGPICPCCHPSAGFGPDGSLYVMWRDAIDGSRDMYMARSVDGGQTFEPARKLGLGTWPLETCPMDGGAIAPGPDGRVLTAWMRDGRLFTAEPDQPERSLGRGVQGWACWGADGPYLTWLDRRPGRLLALLPGDDEPIELARSANDPVVASPIGRPGPVIAAWEAGPGGSGIFASRLDAPKPEE